jgi:hypothetical protein
VTLRKNEGIESKEEEKKSYRALWIEQLLHKNFGG